VENEPAYTTIGLRLGYSIGGFDVDAHVDNLTNKAYRIYGADNSLTAAFVYSIFAPPRTYGVAIEYKFGTPR
jgi:outer membrane receptor protein involved in Fe transport